MTNTGRTTRFTKVQLGSETRGAGEASPLGFSNITTTAPAGAFIPDGFMSVCSHSGNSVVLAIRSGNTIYRFTNASAAAV